MNWLSVQLRKRMYAQAVASLQLALKRSAGEPDEAQALMQNALGFSLAAQNKLQYGHPSLQGGPAGQA